MTLLKDKPIKYPGKIINGSLNEKAQIEEVEKKTSQDLKKVVRQM